MAKYIFGLFLFIAITSSWSQNLELATIADEVVGQQDFWAYVRKRIDLQGQINNTYAAEMALQQMLFARALELESERLNIGAYDKEKKLRFDDMQGYAVYKRIAKPCIRPNEDEAKKYFENHRDEFRIPAFVRLSRVMLPKNGNYDVKSANEVLLDYLSLNKSGMMSFSQIAKKAEKLYNFEAQGDIGWLPLEGDYPPVDILKMARKGEAVGPVEVGGFVYIFEITDMRESRLLNWDEVKLEIADAIYSNCAEKTRNILMAELFERHRVKINRGEIEKIFTK